MYRLKMHVQSIHFIKKTSNFGKKFQNTLTNLLQLTFLKIFFQFFILRLQQKIQSIVIH